MIDPQSPTPSAAASTPLWRALLKLARPKQWAKCAFVLIGPMYGFADGKPIDWLALVGATLAFGLAASGCYVVNDIRDVEADRAHPRKRRRPIASGVVSVPTARVFAGVLLAIAAAMVVIVPGSARLAFGAALFVYVANVMSYSALFKHIVILDVISLACGFVLRVVGGCVATDIEPSPWLLNCTFFLAMFLSFGKRLGERRTMGAIGADAASVRGVQSVYTDDLLRMSVVVTAVATLITYAGYVENRAEQFDAAGDAATAFGWSLYLLWITMLPATYALLRCIVLLERGEYDDPTELAAGDRPFQAAALLFGCVTLGLMVLRGAT